jgi:hypothetical protein
MVRKILCFALTALFTHTASADVLYTWQQVEHSPLVPPGLHLDLVFTDAAATSGAINVEVFNFCQIGQTCETQQDSLMALHYWYDSPDDDRRLNYINYSYGDEMHFGRQIISMNLQFLPDGYLSGSIMANDSNSDFNFVSSGRIFAMLSAHSDEPWGCGFAYPECSGELGTLRTGDQSLPEPSAFATLAIGVLAGWYVRRRRASS